MARPTAPVPAALVFLSSARLGARGRRAAGRLLSLAALSALLLAPIGAAADGAGSGGAAAKPRAFLLTESSGCTDLFASLLCDGFLDAARRTGVEGRIVTPTPRENLVDALSIVAKQRYDLVTALGFEYLRVQRRGGVRPGGL